MWEYWGYCGEIESLDLMRFPDTGRFKGICFITFRTVSASGPLIVEQEFCPARPLHIESISAACQPGLIAAPCQLLSQSQSQTSLGAQAV